VLVWGKCCQLNTSCCLPYTGFMRSWRPWKVLATPKHCQTPLHWHWQLVRDRLGSCWRSRTSSRRSSVLLKQQRMVQQAKVSHWVQVGTAACL
jgi:hypothetical protein